MVITLTLIVVLAALITWGIMRETTAKPQPRHRAENFAALQRNIQAMTKQMRSLAPALQKVGVALNRFGGQVRDKEMNDD